MLHCNWEPLLYILCDQISNPKSPCRLTCAYVEDRYLPLQMISGEETTIDVMSALLTSNHHLSSGSCRDKTNDS